MCCFFILSGFAQTKLNFKYNCSDSVEPPRVCVYLNCSDNKVELLNDTVRKFENSFSVPSKKSDCILFVEFEFKTERRNSRSKQETIDYPFTLVGNETDIEINLNFPRSDYWEKKEGGRIEVIKYYVPDHNLEIKYLPEMQGDKYYKAPFFMLKNNSSDTIYGCYHPNYFWGSISFLVNSQWSSEHFGGLDGNFGGSTPLFPDSVTLAWVGSFGWLNELPKNRYKYSLLYSTDKNTNKGVKQYLEKDNFIWWADTKKYYKLIYEFDVD